MPRSRSSLGIVVGLASLEATNRSEMLTAVALGSCVALILFDPRAKVGGLAHIMLPSRNGARVKPIPAKFADTAVDALLAKMVGKGARKGRVVAKLAGGACMFNGGTNNNSGNSSPDIGRRNVEKVKQLLKKRGIRLKAEDTGGGCARTVKFYSDSGKVVVISPRGQNKEL